ncbi:hypothetical protein E8E12_010696 [Didymella heteroderae]|uniref:DUF788 domain protein n=1 Tax=Didymella heteroderae TaxID=1769908 RepID=A0A9P4WWX5_9PLEO|nr:hypothetical protein E8E12_010696 [Didymella heteroderae]
MAQKATKTLAAANTRRLNTTLYLTIAFHGLFWLLRALIFRSSFTRRSLLLYLFLSAPQLLINLQFERLSRPTFLPDGTIKRAGEDLDAPGLTEYMWDVTYWTYGCVALAALFGDWMWWGMLVVPVYSVYSLYGVYTGFRGAGYQDAAGVPQPGPAQSKRQAKMEKRGGQKVSYR